MPIFSIKESLAFGWRKTLEHLWFVVGVVFVSNGISAFLRTVGDKSSSLFSFFIFIVSCVLSTLMMIGAIKIFLALTRNEQTRFKELFSHVELFWKALGTNILMTLIIFVGFILLIVPGIIFAVKYSFALVFVADKNMSPIAALKESSRITKGHLWHLLGFGLVSIGVIILGLLALGVGVLVAIPVVYFAYAHVYQKLSAAPIPAPVSTPLT